MCAFARRESRYSARVRVIDRRMALSCVVVALVSLGGTARAAPRELAQATAAFEDLRYRDAVRLSDAAWRAGGNSPTELRRLFALAGTAAGSMGDAATAQIWFSRWLCLEPEARLPAGSSPKLAQLLNAARRELAGRALTARITATASGVTVALEDDPLALAVTARAGDVQRPLAAGAVTLAARGPVAVLDRYGNVLVELSVPAAVPVAAPVVVPAPVAAAPVTPRWYARWPVWAVVAAGSAVAGGVALHAAADADGKLDDLAAHSDNHEYSEARAQEQRLDRNQWIARVAFGAAIASATVAVVCVIRGREVRASVVPTGGGAAMTWSLRY